MTDELQRLHRRRGYVLSTITILSKTLDEWDSNSNQRDADYLQATLESMEKAYKKFEDIQEQLEDIDETEIDHREPIIIKYNTALGRARKYLRESRSPTPSTSSSSEIQIVPSSNRQAPLLANLPQINLPSFDGNPENWNSYFDLFQSLIDKTDLEPARKLQYLRMSVKGKAYAAIESLQTTNDNYHTALSILKEKYDCTRQNMMRHWAILREYPRLQKDTPVALGNLVDIFNQHMRSLENLKAPVATWDIPVTDLILSKINPATAWHWEMTLDNNEVPSYKTLLKFLEKRSKYSTFSSTKETSSPKIEVDKFRKQHNLNTRTHSFFTNKRTCPICSDSHTIYQCEPFHKLSAEERGNAVAKAKLCYNCLSYGHGYSLCGSRKGCNKCQGRHHTLLHRHAEKGQRSKINGNTPTSSPSPTLKENTSLPTSQRAEDAPHKPDRSVALVVNSATSDLMVTAVVQVFNCRDKSIQARTLIDTCATSNFMTEDLANALGLKIEKCNVSIGALNTLTTVAKGTVNAVIKSRDNRYERSLTFLVVPSISQRIPDQPIHRENIKIPHNLKLADPNFHKPAEIDLLLGAGVALSLFCVGQMQIQSDKGIELYLQKTRLGWVIGGSAPSIKVSPTHTCHMTNEVYFDLAKFWEVEEGSPGKTFTSEEQTCVQHFQRHVTRNQDGRYVVALPFNERKPDLGESYAMALKRLYNLERKLTRDTELKDQYHAVLTEYLTLGHMSKVTHEQTEGSNYYFPHHAVLKEGSLTTKVRVVFDGSAKSSTGISLNDTLMVGPTIQSDLFSLLLRFRIHQIVITGDIEKMYRQFLVRPEDRRYQRILWRDDDNKIQTYELNTVTFGVGPAPFLAIACLHQLADDEAADFPVASRIVKEDMYVDDAITGADTIEEAVTIRDELISLLERGQLKIRQWASNDPNLLKDLPKESINPHLQIGQSSTIKTLGVSWDSTSDSIIYKVRACNLSDRVTKRQILSQTASIFDPLGLLSPVIIVAKILIQRLWSLKLDWDETLPMDLHCKWVQYYNQLPALNNLSFKRKTVISNARSIQLHGFCDASENAYGACMYLRSVDWDNKVYTELLCAKSKVAPLKRLTIPKLELYGAALLTKLYNIVKDAIPCKLDSVYFWTDSMIVLHWLRTPSKRLLPFVSNRCSNIQANTNINDWYHVRTHDNPADLASRGLLPAEFVRPSLWQHGPEWLNTNCNWPINEITPIPELPELRKVSCFLTKPNVPADNYLWSIFTRFSSFNKLIRVIAYCLRCKRPRRMGPLTLTELRTSHDVIIKLTQQLFFSTEASQLQQAKEIHRNSKLRRLNPIMCTDGLIRVKSRLFNSFLPYSQQNPIILPKNNHITTLIIEREHLLQLHAAITTTFYAVRRQYWPIDGRSQVAKVVHKCVKCSRANPPSVNYVMGNLPSPRVNASLPFTHVGVDYCGPFMIKEKRDRNRKMVKVYVAVFVCLAVKAIHLEVVGDLTSDSFIAALRRFIARRGHCAHIYSDNGTNFVGANNHLRELMTLIRSDDCQKKVQDFLSIKSIHWHFSPPRSPHFGGLWEAAVKAFKYHFKRVVGPNILLHLEQFNTLVIEIEAILNSRPLTPISSDPQDLLVLTPSHFLTGDSLTSLRERDYSEVPSNRLSVWQFLQKLKQHFWNRWKNEYLNELSNRCKWTSGQHSIGENSIVLLREDNMPPLHWPLGRVVKVHPGVDGVIRVVTVKTAKGTVKRCVKQLAPLPIDNINQSDKD